MDLSGVIFVALALAWAVYLIPKALKHHDEVVHSRSIDRFSHTMRVLARREPVGKGETTDARQAVTPAPGQSASVAETVAEKVVEAPVPLTPAQQRARKQAIARATRRRRNVLSLLLLALVATTAVAAAGVIAWSYLAIPGGLIVLWLVTCRIMVKGERRRPTTTRVTTASAEAVDEPETPATQVEVERNDQGFDELAPESDTATVAAVDSEGAEREAGVWDPLPMTLPTYVGKPTAERRSVRDISIDDSGVWTSGRTESDAAIAREADAQRRSERAARSEAERRRAVGS